MDYSETRAYLAGLYHAYSQGDFGPTMAAMSDDIIFEYVGPTQVFPFCGVRRGKAAMLAAMGEIAATFDLLSLVVERILVDDQGYVGILEGQFRNKQTGVTMACKLIDVAITKGDLIVELREYWDVEAVTQQLMGQKLMLAPTI